MTSQLADMTLLSRFSQISLFLLSSLVTDPSFMSISWPSLNGAGYELQTKSVFRDNQGQNVRGNL